MLNLKKYVVTLKNDSTEISFDTWAVSVESIHERLDELIKAETRIIIEEED